MNILLLYFRHGGANAELRRSFKRGLVLYSSRKDCSATSVSNDYLSDSELPNDTQTLISTVSSRHRRHG